MDQKKSKQFEKLLFFEFFNANSRIHTDKHNKAKRREGRLIITSRLTIEDIFQCWFTPYFSISEEDHCISS